MDIAVKERLVGAAVLVVIVVLVVPALLSGPRPPAAPAEAPSGDTRVVEIDLAGAGGSREVSPPQEAAEPAPSRAEEGAAALPAPVGNVPVPPEDAQPAAAPAPPVAERHEPPAPVPVSAGGGWAVQVAALSKQDAAEQMVARLKGKGYPAYVLEHPSGGQVLYRVRVGPEVQRERAESLAGRLRDEGFKPAVVAQP